MNKQFLSFKNYSGWHCALNYGSYQEHHFMLELSDNTQVKHCVSSLLNLIQKHKTTPLNIGGNIKLFIDSSNDFISSLNDTFESIVFTQVKQKLLSNNAIGFWATLFTGNITCKKEHNNLITIITPNFERYFWGGLAAKKLPNAGSETTSLFELLGHSLKAYNMSVSEHVHRTWFFIDDIDSNYHDFTQARKEWFINEGLNSETHYIASTGIEGANTLNARMLFDALAYKSNNLEVRYLSAPEHLNPTIEYGVTFERGVLLKMAHSQHIYISGTASIDNNGAVVHVGDPKLQTIRALQNIESLLKNVNSGLKEVCQALVYVKNESDFDQIKLALENYIPDFPCIYTLGAVCRPDWLVEIECTIVR